MRNRSRSAALLGAFALLLAAPAARADEPSHFPLKDGDVWVMVGDSITAQHLHSNYFEAFCYARYPDRKFAFRNSGVGGDTIRSAINRFDWDAAAWKPTVISVELGMNDKGGFTVEKYMDNMKEFTLKVKVAGARPVYLSPSPVNNGSMTAKLDGGNQRLSDYTDALKKYAEEQMAPFADQFHQLVDVWGKNKPNENLLNTLKTIQGVAADDKLEGVEHLRAFLKVHEKSKDKLVSMQGDPVHPGPPGQLMMAAALLKDLGADGFVSSATLDAGGKVVEAKGCKIENYKTDDGRIVFDRTDNALPFPMPDDARPVLPLSPTVLDLSQYTLKVAGLNGKFDVKVNDIVIGSVTGDELAKGVNLTTFAKGPIADQGKAILAAVSQKEGLVGQWRGMSKAAAAPNAPEDAKTKLAAQTKLVEQADEKIRDAAKPKKLHFEIAPAK